MNKTLNNALATVKRYTEDNKYPTYDRVLSVIYEYYLNEDEATELVKRYNKWCDKNYYKSEKVELDSILNNI